MKLTQNQKENNKFNRELAAESSWLCRIFQEGKVNKKGKKEVIRRCMSQYKSKV